MANENGEWIMHGVSDRNPSCIKTMHERDPWLWRELIARSSKAAYGESH